MEFLVFLPALHTDEKYIPFWGLTRQALFGPNVSIAQRTEWAHTQFEFYFLIMLPNRTIYDAERKIRLDGKFVLITGANTGIGYEVSLILFTLSSLPPPFSRHASFLLLLCLW